MLIDIIKVIIIGIVEGITEWLPISSTGHMILLDEFIKLNISKEFKEMFLVVIQLGAILAVVVLFFDKLNPLTAKKSKKERMDTISLWIKVAIGCIPAVAIGLPFNDIMDKYFYNYKVVTFTLILYGILFIIIENRNKTRRVHIKNFEQLTYKTAFFIGMFQVLSLIPGTSRSGATILGGIILGASRYIAAEFAFFLAIPIMFGASLLKLVKFGFAFTGHELAILIIGMITAFVVSIITIKYLIGYIKKSDFKIFGYYRIALGIIVVLYFMIMG